ncbi:hypothetical protein B0T16DRAFT_459092 [Cercophora newfieldiana]|uniref:Uncharacterized protein n=1 Tax=Cercophora newfieldiana TaxID=92897 RepID=A0AA39XZ01_9PEZI|nr:hypothetical protein B0T16DRAFT_459092 [Cercophora newfieldiana]
MEQQGRAPSTLDRYRPIISDLMRRPVLSGGMGLETDEAVGAQIQQAIRTTMEALAAAGVPPRNVSRTLLEHMILRELFALSGMPFPSELRCDMTLAPNRPGSEAADEQPESSLYRQFYTNRAWEVMKSRRAKAEAERAETVASLARLNSGVAFGSRAPSLAPAPLGSPACSPASSATLGHEDTIAAAPVQCQQRAAASENGNRKRPAEGHVISNGAPSDPTERAQTPFKRPRVTGQRTDNEGHLPARHPPIQHPAQTLAALHLLHPHVACPPQRPPHRHMFFSRGPYGPMRPPSPECSPVLGPGHAGAHHRQSFTSVHMPAGASSTSLRPAQPVTVTSGIPPGPFWWHRDLFATPGPHPENTPVPGTFSSFSEPEDCEVDHTADPPRTVRANVWRSPSAPSSPLSHPCRT